MDVCQVTGCGKPASMVCPTCRKLGISGSFFCSQACFKENWATHKIVHKLVKDAAAASARAKLRKPAREGFEGYRFTGALRPGTVSEQATVPARIVKPDYADLGVPTSEEAERGSNKVHVHTAEEIEIMREVGRLGREVIDEAGGALKAGATPDEIDHIVFDACMARDCYPSPLNYYGFPKSVCVSVNEVICHGIPDSRPFENGDIVNLDVTVYKHGFHADLNETYIIGETDEKSAALVRCRPGTMYRDLGKEISKVARRAGFSVVKSYCGHGVGRLFHTAPNVPHYAKNKAVGTMREGHVFTIEPMINVGSPHDQTWPDGWTAVTVDGKRSAQFEHSLLVTATGVEILTARPGSSRTEMVWSPDAVHRPLGDRGEDSEEKVDAPSASA